MANIVNNLRVNNAEVKKILMKLRGESDFSSLKELYYNGVLIWKNANPFIFLSQLTEEKIKEILLSYGAETIIFEGFGNEDEILGSYSIVENAELEKNNLVLGQMVVEKTTEGEE